MGSGRRDEKERLEQLDRDIQLIDRGGGKNGLTPGASQKRQIVDIEKKKVINESKKSLAERTAKAAQNPDEVEVARVKMTVGGMESTFTPKTLPPKGPRAPSSNAANSGGFKKSFATKKK